MKKEEVFLVDTNLIVYAYEKENSLRKKKSLEILEKCYKKEIVLAVSNQNLAEFSVVSLKKLKLDANIVKDIVKDISNFEGFKKINYKRKTILSAIDILEEYKMSFWDSLIAATMIENGILSIYTENSKDFKIPSLNVVNPFC
ncbi:MAG: PIN domain-containing protein [Nanoarchaeota archaeon]|nr:PIN domain-containing protein [Nanoarchaeota archaeon]